jgi:DNA-binding transcriptional regulator GbsR (MarR family)
MELEEAKHRFIQAWGGLGSSWGINRTMSQIHALLLVSPEALSAEDIMEGLKVSRGNVNMNVRALMDWGLVKKELIPGERKEFFIADKDVNNMARQIARERRRRELQPVIEIMEEVKGVKGSSAEVKEFKAVVNDIAEFTGQLDSLSDKFIRSDRNWFFRVMMKVLK